MLLVEDEPEVRKVVRMQLTSLGHVVIEAADGVEALGLLENVDDIALLVSDTVMPGGIGGRELARRARTLRPQLPILLVTGYASEATPTDELPADVPTLRKPFDQAALAVRWRPCSARTGGGGGVEDASPTAPAADGEARSRIMNTTTEPRPNDPEPDRPLPGPDLRARGRPRGRPPDLHEPGRIRLPLRTDARRPSAARARAPGIPDLASWTSACPTWTACRWSASCRTAARAQC